MNKQLEKILVWDWPTSVGHWALVVSFVVAYASAESESWRLVHVISGLIVAGIVSFRVIWGVLGTRHALFSGFVRGPSRALAYVRELMHGDAPHFTGHNPAGAIAIVLLVLLCLLIAGSGWAVYNEAGPHGMGSLHELLAHACLLVILVHVAGVVTGSLVHKENLVRAMLTGRKLGKAGEAIVSARLWAVPLLLIWVAGIVWYFR